MSPAPFDLQGERVSANWITWNMHLGNYTAPQFYTVWRTGSGLAVNHQGAAVETKGRWFWNLQGGVCAPPSMKETIKRTTQRRRRRNRTGLMDGW